MRVDSQIVNHHLCESGSGLDAGNEKRSKIVDNFLGGRNGILIKLLLLNLPVGHDQALNNIRWSGLSFVLLQQHANLMNSFCHVLESPRSISSEPMVYLSLLLSNPKTQESDAQDIV